MLEIAPAPSPPLLPALPPPLGYLTPTRRSAPSSRSRSPSPSSSALPNHQNQKAKRPSPYPSPITPGSLSMASMGASATGRTSPQYLSPPCASPSSLGTPIRRPVPKRAHSFCGDASTPTYALASTPTRSLALDKKTLVAPPLERTISSLGSEGNTSPKGMQMVPPPSLVRRSTEPASTTRSPQRESSYREMIVPRITVTTTPPRTSVLPPTPTSQQRVARTPPRPALNPFQPARAPRYAPYNDEMPIPRQVGSPATPALEVSSPLAVDGGASSRSSSFLLTPLGSLAPLVQVAEEAEEHDADEEMQVEESVLDQRSRLEKLSLA